MAKYIILIYSGDSLFFLGWHGEYTPNADEAMLFGDELSAKVYIDKRGMEKITSVRRIHFQSK